VLPTDQYSTPMTK